MDAKDKKKIKQSLENLNNDQMENGIVIEKVISQVNETDSVLNRHIEIMAQFDANFQVLSSVVQNTEAKFNFMTHFDETKQTFLVMFYEVERKVDDIHQTLIDLHNHVLNSKVVNINEILTGMGKIVLTNKNIRLPFDAREPNYDDVRKLMKFVVARKGDTLILVFSLPLVENDLFSLTRLYAIPHVEGEVAYFVNISRKFMIKDKHIEKWAPLSENELDKCTRASFYVCEGLKILNTNKESCESTMIATGIKKLQKFCDIKAMRIPKVTVVKMFKENAFLVMARGIVKGKLVKDNGVLEVELNGTQIVEEKDAVLHIETLELTFVGSEVSIDEKIAVKMTNWNVKTADLYLEDKEILNLPRISLPAILKTEELNLMGKDLELVRKEKMLRREREGELNLKSTSLWTIGVCMAIMVIAMIYIGVHQRVKIRKYYMSVFEDKDKTPKPQLSRSERSLIDNA